MSRGPLVAIGAIVVLGAAIGLVVLLGVSDDESVAANKPPGDLVVQPKTPPPLGNTNNPSVVVTDMPRMPGGESSVPPSGEHPREYAVGDVTVRDHRAGDNKPLDIPPNSRPADARMLPSQLTHAISGKVRSVISECVASLPREGRGTKPRVEGVIDVSIKNANMSITKSTMQIRDVDNPSAVDAVKQCIESRSIGQSTLAADEADLESYPIRMSVVIP